MNIKLELKYGFWMAFALFIWWVVEYILGWQNNDLEKLSYSINISNVVVIVVGLFLVMKLKKENTYSNEIKYGTLALSGGIALLTAGILILTLSSIFYHFVNTEWQLLTTEMNLKEFAGDLEGEELEKKREMYMAMFAPGSMGMQNFSRFIMYGFFILLIEALLLLKLPIGTGSK